LLVEVGAVLLVAVEGQGVLELVLDYRLLPELHTQLLLVLAVRQAPAGAVAQTV
jgi:hypothetical protein